MPRIREPFSEQVARASRYFETQLDDSDARLVMRHALASTSPHDLWLCTTRKAIGRAVIGKDEGGFRRVLLGPLVAKDSEALFRWAERGLDPLRFSPQPRFVGDAMALAVGNLVMLSTWWGDLQDTLQQTRRDMRVTRSVLLA